MQLQEQCAVGVLELVFQVIALQFVQLREQRSVGVLELVFKVIAVQSVQLQDKRAFFVLEFVLQLFAVGVHLPSFFVFFYVPLLFCYHQSSSFLSLFIPYVSYEAML